MRDSTGYEHDGSALRERMDAENARPTLYGRELHQKLLAEQRRWIEVHGTTLAAYIERYGDPGVPTCTGRPMYGDGGTAIFRADMAELARLERLA